MRAMRITVNDETYDYDGKLMLPEAILIEKVTGMTQVEWENKLQNGGALAQAALIWILMRRHDPAGTPKFTDLTYDTHAIDVMFLRQDGVPIDMEQVAADIDARVEAGEPREKAAVAAMEAAGKAPAAAEVTENPTVAGTTGPPAPPRTLSPAPSPGTGPSSPTTSVSAPGSSTA